MRLSGEAIDCIATLTTFSSRVEPAVVGEGTTCYVDLGRLATKDDAVALGSEVGRAVRDACGHGPALGMAAGKFSARAAATHAAPNRLVYVAPGGEADFLAPLPIERLPFDGDTVRRLRRLGIRTLGQFAALPVGAVSTQFGTDGCRLQRLARGHDDRPVQLYRPPAHVRAARQFDDPVVERDVLAAVLRALADEIAPRMGAKQQAGRRVHLVVEAEDGAVRTYKRAFSEAVADADRLSRSCVRLLAHVQHAVVAMEVIVTALTPVGGRQLELFAPRNGRHDRLHEALPALIERYGAESFRQIKFVAQSTPLPEHRFRLQEREV